MKRASTNESRLVNVLGRQLSGTPYLLLIIGQRKSSVVREFWVIYCGAKSDFEKQLIYDGTSSLIVSNLCLSVFTHNSFRSSRSSDNSRLRQSEFTHTRTITKHQAKGMPIKLCVPSRPRCIRLELAIIFIQNSPSSSSSSFYFHPKCNKIEILYTVFIGE